MGNGSDQPSASNSASDYETVGGGQAVALVVDQFYSLILQDPALAGYFDDVDMARLKRHQVQLISQVLGGPVVYSGGELAAAHEGLGIDDEAFGRVVGHLVTALTTHQVPEDIVNRVLAALAEAKPAVVGAENS